MMNCNCTDDIFCGKRIADVMTYSMISNLEFRVLHNNSSEFSDIKYDDIFLPANFPN